MKVKDGYIRVAPFSQKHGCIGCEATKGETVVGFGRNTVRCCELTNREPDDIGWAEGCIEKRGLFIGIIIADTEEAKAEYIRKKLELS